MPAANDSNHCNVYSTKQSSIKKVIKPFVNIGKLYFFYFTRPRRICDSLIFMRRL